MTTKPPSWIEKILLKLYGAKPEDLEKSVRLQEARIRERRIERDRASSSLEHHQYDLEKEIMRGFEDLMGDLDKDV